jgi:hypothetical protein
MPDPLSPKPGDSNFTESTVFVSEAELLIRESFPPQIALRLRGELPTPCHQLRVKIEEPDAENRIHVETYSIVNPDLACVQVTKPFEENVNLGTFPSGHYTVWLNGEMIGEFDS